VLERKKIIVLTTTFPRWQDDTDPPFVYELSRRLARDFDVHVLAPHYPGALLRERMAGMEVSRFRYFFSPFEKLAGSTSITSTLRNNKFYFLLVPFLLIAELVALLCLCKDIKPDAVHAHWLIPQGAVALCVKRILGVPFLVTVHGSDIFGLRGRLLSWVKRGVLADASAISAVSNAIRAEVALLKPGAECSLISMGVDSARFSGPGDGSVRKRFGIAGEFLLFVGRLSEQKGVRYLLEAMPQVVSRFPKAKLLIVGSGEEEHSFKELSRTLGLENQVIFAGAISNRELPPVYADADLFIGPSIRAKGGETEGFGLTFVEAGMSGCVLLGSDVGGIADIIRDEETGFLVPEKDSGALAARIVAILERRNQWPQITARTREELVKRFDWEVVSRKYTDILRVF